MMWFNECVSGDWVKTTSQRSAVAAVLTMCLITVHSGDNGFEQSLSTVVHKLRADLGSESFFFFFPSIKKLDLFRNTYESQKHENKLKYISDVGFFSFLFILDNDVEQLELFCVPVGQIWPTELYNSAHDWIPK